jgi:hypothetical protein
VLAASLGGHVLTPHERQLFRDFESHTSLKMAHRVRGQKLAHWPYSGAWSPPLQLDPLGAAIHNAPPKERARWAGFVHAELNNGGGEHPAVYSEEDPPCYTPEDCHRRAEVNERARATRGLPEYDHDVPELLAAMQQQDQMIADHKSAREQRARNAANMSPLKPARLPQVRCGGQCQAKGVWCCRLG